MSCCQGVVGGCQYVAKVFRVFFSMLLGCCGWLPGCYYADTNVF